MELFLFCVPYQESRRLVQDGKALKGSLISEQNCLKFLVSSSGLTPLPWSRACLSLIKLTVYSVNRVVPRIKLFVPETDVFQFQGFFVLKGLVTYE